MPVRVEQGTLREDFRSHQTAGAQAIEQLAGDYRHLHRRPFAFTLDGQAGELLACQIYPAQGSAHSCVAIPVG